MPDFYTEWHKSSFAKKLSIFADLVTIGGALTALIAAGWLFERFKKNAVHLSEVFFTIFVVSTYFLICVLVFIIINAMFRKVFDVFRIKRLRGTILVLINVSLFSVALTVMFAIAPYLANNYLHLQGQIKEVQVTVPVISVPSHGVSDLPKPSAPPAPHRPRAKPESHPQQ